MNERLGNDAWANKITERNGRPRTLEWTSPHHLRRHGVYLKHCWTASNRHMSSPKRTTSFQYKDIICHSRNISPASRSILFATRHISLRYHIGYLQPAKITGHMCPVGQCSSTRTNRDITFPKRNTSFPNETTSSPERNISWPNIQIIFAKRIIWFRRDCLRVVSSTHDTSVLGGCE